MYKIKYVKLNIKSYSTTQSSTQSRLKINETEWKAQENLYTFCVNWSSINTGTHMAKRIISSTNDVGKTEYTHTE